MPALRYFRDRAGAPRRWRLYSSSRESAPLGARAARPQVGRRPTGVFMRARCPRSQGKRRAERPSLGARAARPHVGRRPTGVFMRARCPRSQESAVRSGRPWERGRPARTWAEGPPVCSCGQDARDPRESAWRSGRPWERGRPARKWAEGPPVCSCGQDARAPRKAPSGVAVPGNAGVPPASGPKAHRCVHAGKMPALPGKRRAERASLGTRASRPQVGRRPTGVLKRAGRPRSRENRANVSGRMTNPGASTFLPECSCGIESLQVPWAFRCKSSVPCPD